MLKFFYFLLLIFLVYKGVQFIKGLLYGNRNDDVNIQSGKTSKYQNTKIDKNNVIDADFEEIDAKDKSSSKN